MPSYAKQEHCSLDCRVRLYAHELWTHFENARAARRANRLSPPQGQALSMCVRIGGPARSRKMRLASPLGDDPHRQQVEGPRLLGFEDRWSSTPGRLRNHDHSRKRAAGKQAW